MKRVYIAGALNAMACDYIKNLHRMIVKADHVRRAGFSVFVPGLDFLSGLVDGRWDYEDFFNNNQAWLLVSEAMFVVYGWENSAGTKKEIELAKKLNIPVFYEVDDLVYWRDGLCPLV